MTLEQLSASLRDELAANDVRRLVDPRTMPVRFRHLVAMGRSPLHCLAAFQEPDRTETLSMKLGSGTHAMVGGDRPVVVYPGKVRRGKEFDAFRSLHPHAVILTAKEHAKAAAMDRAIRANEEACALLFGPGVVREQQLHFTLGGRACVATPDAYGPYGVIELKTARDSQPGRFTREAIWRGYVAQVCWYQQAVREVTGKPVTGGYVVAVESAEPYAVTVLRLTERAIERGTAQWRGYFERLLVCEQSGSWPAYSQCVVDLDYPEDDIDLVFGDGDASGNDSED